jgi:hypothetical protein
MDSTRVIWGGGLSVHLILLAVLLRQGRAQRFPFFTLLIVFYILRSLFLFAFYQHMSRLHYTWTFWSFALADLLLQAIVLSELLRGAYQKAGVSQRGRALGGLTGIVLAGILVYFWGPWPSLTTPGTDEINFLMVMSVLANKGNLLIAILTLQTMLVLIFTAPRSGLGWSSHTQRIAHGLAFYALINVSVQAAIQKLSQSAGQLSATQIQSTMHTIQTLGYARTWGYFAAALYWIIFLWRDEPKQHLSGTEVLS